MVVHHGECQSRRSMFVNEKLLQRRKELELAHLDQTATGVACQDRSGCRHSTMSRQKPAAQFDTCRKIGQPLAADLGFAAKRPRSESVPMSVRVARTRDTPQRRSGVNSSDRVQAC